MDVSIIIVNYNTTLLLMDTIDSVFEKTESIEYEIIVVDNNSPNDPEAILTEKYGEKIIYLSLSENIGFGRANNEAAKIAKGRNLFFLNPDTIVLNNAVKVLSDYLDNNPKVGCCGGNLLDKEGVPAHSFGRFFVSSLFYEINQLFLRLPEKILYGKNSFYNHTNYPMKVCFITGADLMVRKSVFDRLNGFDPDFFMYFEEAELEYRVAKEGYKIMSVPNGLIIHLEGKSCQNNLVRLEKNVISRNIFLQKTKSSVVVFIINTMFFARILTRLFICFIMNDNEKMAVYKLWLGIKKKFASQVDTGEAQLYVKKRGKQWPNKKA